ncbi:MAG: NPCBM/NEW2 domain-containing protein [Planctomycetota bacterium]
MTDRRGEGAHGNAASARRRRAGGLLVAATTLVAATPLAAQEPARARCELLLVDGSTVSADALTGTPAPGARWRTGGDGGREVDGDRVLAVLAGGVQPSELPAAHLLGGDVLRGLLVGGDGGGDALDLQSPVLGALRVPVDRLECMVLQPALARPRDLVLPEGEDEALFLKATLGFDRIVGTLHQFGEPGIRFQPGRRDQPEWYGVRDLVGLRLGGAVGPSTRAVAEVWTRSGDRIGARAFAFTGDALTLTLESGVDVQLELADLGCLVRSDRGAEFLSALTPKSAVEAAVGGDVLLPWQRDAAVTGAPLVAGGRCYGRGLGVHSRSRLDFEVPAGAASFLTRVAFDDTALLLPVRGAVDVAVWLDGRAVFEQQDLRAGDAPRAIGPVPVRPGQVLTLEVDFGAGRDLGDRVAWLLPAFLPAP